MLELGGEVLSHEMEKSTMVSGIILVKINNKSHNFIESDRKILDIFSFVSVSLYLQNTNLF